ncbi:FAD-dependent oxidoreductase [uncultured Castellaniella sp.]|uniref:FAD-dependent oxidoreductase n=1 Tax=uncultured Castellaniella sp. TaxID=647907 RepID=UPI002631F269|nr:FAD-dependent oxidoreductase [uncultured Castellaniella sp.]
MNTQPLQDNMRCDVLIVGAGVAGLTTAIVAAKQGLRPVVVEKAPVFGGTAAFSGGVLWIPGNHVARQSGIQDSREAALDYIKHETGGNFDPQAIEAFLDKGPEMAEFFERETEVKFIPTQYPDYHPDQVGAALQGRSILAKPFDIRALGPDMKRLRPPLKTITFIGMMFNSSSPDIKHFFNVTKSLTSFLYVTRRLSKHLKELLLYRRGINVTSGNALMARLAKTALDLNIPIYTESPVISLIRDGERIAGAVVRNRQNDIRIHADRAVVLAAGGFPHDEARLRQTYPHVARGGRHLSPTPTENTGDGVRIAEQLGASLELDLPNASAWIPVSHVPLGGGRYGVFPHLIDRYKPGMIGVTSDGRRFTNESNSYHDVGQAMIKACEGSKETAMWLICDHPTIRKYGLGYAKPAPMPLGPMLKRGYLKKGATLKALAQAAGIDPEGLEETVRAFNEHAIRGEDPAFHRGSTAFNRYLGDAEHQPNPCVAPITTGPFYALKLLMGDLGTFEGLRTAVTGEVLDRAGQAIPGLYAVGNDRASIFGGNYIAAGITLGPNMTFGYITARHIAKARR